MPAPPPPPLGHRRSPPRRVPRSWRDQLGRERRDLRRAVETLAAAHHHPRAPLEATEIRRGQRPNERRLDFPPGYAFAVADDRAGRRTVDPARPILGQVRHADKVRRWHRTRRTE